MTNNQIPPYLIAFILCLTFTTACEDIKAPILDSNNTSTDTGFTDTDIDTDFDTPPTSAVTITAAPETETDQTNATFAFTCDASPCDLECSLDDTEFEPCTSPITYNDLEPGKHDFAVRLISTNDESNSPAQHSWTITIPKPSILVTTRPDAETYFRNASFAFECDTNDPADQCELTCSLDGDDFAPCNNTFSSNGLSHGEHELIITATNKNSSQQTSLGLEWKVLPLHWTSLSAAKEHTCGLLADNSLWCWGYHQYGRTGIEEISGSTTVPMQVEGSWKSVSNGAEHTCAINTDDELYCWGRGQSGRLGTGNQTNAASPSPVLTDGTQSADWLSVSAGAEHTCAVRKNGQAYCWGSNEHGQIGAEDNARTMFISPQNVGPHSDWIAIAAGGLHTCGIRKNPDGTALYCWGNYQLSTNPTPKILPEYYGTTFVSAGDRHTCVLRTQESSNEADALICFGSNDSNQVNASIFNNNSTTKNHGGGWSTVSAGTRHTCGIKSAELKCWGHNITPSLIPDASNWRAVAAGDEHTCLIDEDYQAKCFGTANFGQTGAGNNQSTNSPTPVAWPY